MTRILRLAALPIAIVASATQGAQAQAQTQNQIVESETDSEIAAPLQSAAMEWLGTVDGAMHLRAGGGTNLFWAGFFPEEQMTPKLLVALNSDPQMPGYIHIPAGRAKRHPIELIYFESQGPNPVRCGALLQITVDTGQQQDEVENKLQINKFRNLIPDHPLDQDCKPVIPWKPQSHPQPPLVGSNNKLALYQHGRLIEVEPGLTCSDFKESTGTSIPISERTKFVFTTRVNGYETQSGQIGSINLFQSVAAFERGFQIVVREAGLPKLQFLSNGYILDRPDVVAVDLAIIDEKQSNLMCLAATFRHGDTTWTMVRPLQREGRHALWSPVAWSRLPPAASNLDKKLWDVPSDARAIGQDAAKLLLAR